MTRRSLFQRLAGAVAGSVLARMAIAIPEPDSDKLFRENIVKLNVLMAEELRRLISAPPDPLFQLITGRDCEDPELHLKMHREFAKSI